jgi:surface protein
MSSMFMNCTHLVSVPLLDTSSVTDMASMFNYCVRLTSIPLFNTSACRDMYTMFDSCRKVESGALALYNQASSQSPGVTRHNYCFRNCGADTTTGRAELAQIGTGWK